VSIGNAFSWGWTKFTQNVGTFIGVAAVMLGVTILINGLLWVILFAGASTGSEGGFIVSLILSALFVAVLFFIQFVFYLPFVRAVMMLTRGEKPIFAELFKTEGLGNFVGGAALMAIGVFLGTLLCYVPGIIFAFFGLFWAFFIVDRNLGPVEAIKSSFGLVNRNLGAVVLLYIGVMIAIFIGYLLCGIGILAALPVSLLAAGYVYKTLNGETVAA